MYSIFCCGGFRPRGKEGARSQKEMFLKIKGGMVGPRAPVSSGSATVLSVVIAKEYFLSFSADFCNDLRPHAYGSVSIVVLIYIVSIIFILTHIWQNQSAFSWCTNWNPFQFQKTHSPIFWCMAVPKCPWMVPQKWKACLFHESHQPSQEDCWTLLHSQTHKRKAVVLPEEWNNENSFFQLASFLLDHLTIGFEQNSPLSPLI